MRVEKLLQFSPVFVHTLANVNVIPLCVSVCLCACACVCGSVCLFGTRARARVYIVYILSLIHI